MTVAYLANHEHKQATDANTHLQLLSKDGKCIARITVTSAGDKVFTEVEVLQPDLRIVKTGKYERVIL